ncbi:RNA-binding protein 12B [Pelodiscus sinensis]|uniref:RNA binding motif protein 12B n=1 Tax=Pelodiscus sinensis TaxID=13735 RepID=K7EZY6_PELSI|nr:RNA-binding protein 12B [Pelodiscus sinensis]XP_014427014.1 RNA-binding protein 12B [Pelodiscus sinensis]XP_014427017.1 RNA-binding protein 12B [Pelodiscus sinensis]XP_025038399.1 RNA-binding protein 12B [Pelodiscus sinensis]XP_025038401.1 RNA-binding protein 12B [Pelodiscus sinensis]|eukprot:XP_006111079.1 RNA-binding protein 12B [Pelodiscus sinensis]
MAVVIRLQGLPVVAGPADIRRFFSGLNIPDGGVHIIGGETGEAFIIFATDEDARRAMSCSGGLIKDSHIELFLSSKTEMQNTIEMSRKRFDRGGRETLSGSRRTSGSNSGTSGVGSLSNLVAAITKGMNKSGYVPSNHQESGFHTNGTRHGDSRKESQSSDDVYLFLHGIPYSATEYEVRAFFSGLRVEGVIFIKRRNGLNNGDGLVKFATSHGALEGLKRHKQYMGSRFIEISPATEEQWIEYGGRVDMKSEIARYLSKERSPTRRSNYTPSRKHSHSRSPPRRQRTRSRSPHSQEFYIHLRNLSTYLEKKDLRAFFEQLDVSNNQIKFLLDSHQRRTRNAFVMFRSQKDFEIALGFHRQFLFNRPVYIFPISRRSMLKLIESYEKKRSQERDQPGQAVSEKSYREGRPGPKMCIYIRNFPFDVTKVEVQKFFAGFAIDEDDIYLLYDDKGVGLGEALVKFKSEEQAMKAESLNRRRFLGTEVLLRLISEEQMREFGIHVPPSAQSGKVQVHSQAFDRGEHSRPAASPPGQPQGLSMNSFGPPGSFRHPPDVRRPPEDFRGPPPFMDFGGDGESYGRVEYGNNNTGGFPEGRFMSDPNFSGGGSDRVTPIRLKNLPFRATPNEILDFFYGYSVIPESVSIQYNEHGLPSGDAIVAMANYEEAMSAINELNDRPVGPRKVKLSLL